MTHTIRLALSIASLFLSTTLMGQPNDTELTDPHPGDQSAWQSLQDIRVGWGSIDQRYRRSSVPQVTRQLSLRAWRGEHVNAQALVAVPRQATQISFDITDFKCGNHKIASSQVTKYFVRYVMADGGFTPCGEDKKKGLDSILVADRLSSSASLTVEGNTTRPLWLDIHVPESAHPGIYRAQLNIRCNDQNFSLPIQLTVSKRILPKPKDWKFHLDLWQNPYAVARYYQVPLWSEEHFRLMRPMMESLANAGQKVITASIIQHPWNSQTEDPFESMVMKKRNLDGSWTYDYSVFDKWVSFAMDCGITQQIACYTLVPWGYKFDYFDGASNAVKYVSCKPGTKEYEDLILPFLKDFAKHLKEKGWFSRTCIAMDERPMDQLHAAHEVVKRADPDYQIEGAADYYPEVEPLMYDLSLIYTHPILKPEVLKARQEAGKKTTFYICCGPERPNTFTFSEPAESTYLGWHTAALGYDGVLRWAYNSWTAQPNQDSRFRSWTSGDCFLVYPGGSSIRMQRLVQGIQDYEKIQVLKKHASRRQLAKIEKVLEKFKPTDYPEGTDAAKLVNEAERMLQNLE